MMIQTTTEVEKVEEEVDLDQVAETDRVEMTKIGQILL